eukprot:2435163-Rhodomonas_salina.1
MASTLVVKDRRTPACERTSAAMLKNRFALRLLLFVALCNTFSTVSTFAPLLPQPPLQLFSRCKAFTPQNEALPLHSKSRIRMVAGGTELREEAEKQPAKTGFRAWVQRKSRRLFGGEDFAGSAEDEPVGVATGPPFQVKGTIDELKDYVRTFEKY